MITILPQEVRNIFFLSWQFAPEALPRPREDGEVRYLSYGVEAVLVGPQGVVIPPLTEFCENQGGEASLTKQDCELKAFYRLAPRLKQFMGKHRLLMIADGLYPNGPVMQLCRQNNWDFMIVLLADGRKTVGEDARGIHRLEPEQSKTNKWGDRKQSFWWANHIPYVWRDAGNQRHTPVVHVVV